jgi:hypothetical protein
MTTSAGTRARVLCCTAQPHPQAMTALEAYAPQAELVDVKDDKFGYWREISARWTGERDLVLIEQDIEISEDTIRSLEECDQDWCVFAYPIFRSQSRLIHGLGCTKVSTFAQRLATAELIADGFYLCAACHGEGCWWHLDGRITEVLRGRGFLPHVHGDVTHLHDYSAMKDTEPCPGHDIVHGQPETGGKWEIPWRRDAVGYEPAQVVVHSIPWTFAETPRQATDRANQLAALAELIAVDPSQAVAGSGPPCIIRPDLITGPAAAFQTDKIAHGYMPAYHKIAARLGLAARVCEVGVFFGGSLATWQVIFPDGLVAGVDNYRHAQWPEGTVRIFASQDDPELPKLLAEHSAQWDLIVDDASHDGRLTAKTLGLLWPLVAPGGYYVIEDWFTGYDDYPGYDDSMLRLAEALLERLHEDTDTDSVEYRHGMAIIRKKES